MSDTKPTIDTKNKITVRVLSQSGRNDITFQLNKTTPFKKVFSSYCSNLGVKEGGLRFLFNGVSIKENDTPESIGMENNDSIDALLEQVGGQ